MGHKKSVSQLNFTVKPMGMESDKKPQVTLIKANRQSLINDGKKIERCNSAMLQALAKR